MLATVARIMVKILRVSCFMTKHERVADKGDDVNSPRRLPMLAMPSFGVADPLRVFPSPTPLRVATSSTSHQPRPLLCAITTSTNFLTYW